MGTRSILPSDCVQACQRVSLRLDSNLSEFEEALLDAHLEGCADCRAHAGSLTALTEILRTAVQEEPGVSFQPPRRRAALALPLPRFRPALRNEARIFVRSAISAAAVGVVAISGVVGLHLSATSAPGADLRNARELMGLKERALEQLEVVAAPAPARLGLTAVEQVTLRANPGARREAVRTATRLSFLSDG
jgi:predicted anti-sigma-YlaC factor YlaD